MAAAPVGFLVLWFLDFQIMGTLAYEIGGVGVQITEDCATRWNGGTVTEDDLLTIEVIAGEDRWPGGRPSMKTVRDNERFADLWKMIEDNPANRITHN